MDGTILQTMVDLGVSLDTLILGAFMIKVTQALNATVQNINERVIILETKENLK